ncbi:CaiB/BaiF CoA transferase family protein [Chloroflexota bacterium]
MEKVLEGVRVIDLGRYIAGPYCALLLADMGAEVIRVERPGGEPDRTVGALTDLGWGVNYINLARNKKAITLNLGHADGRELMKKLVTQSDIIIGAYRGGEMESMGLGYDVLSRINPGIILVLVSGFGQTGPYAQRLAFDTIAQAVSGAMSVSGFPGNPPTKAQVFYSDFGSGVHAALGAMFALYHRKTTGKGQMIDVSLLDTAVAFMHGIPAEYRVTGRSRRQTGNRTWYTVGDLYRAKDGWVYIFTVTNHMWQSFIRAIGKEDLGAGMQSDQERFENQEPKSL